jgi:phage tail sheath protein FI
MPIQEGGTFSPNSRVVSPGVFTRENDQSGVASGIADIGGVVVAPFSKGPAFAPTTFTNLNTFQNRFGLPDGTYYGPYTAAEYLAERGLVTVCRVGGLTGYEQKYPFAIWAVKGQYNRAASAGALNSGSSYVYFSGSASNQYSESVSWNHPTGSIMSLVSASFTVTFNGTPSDVAVPFDPSSASGSILYSGQTITLGTTNVSTILTNVSQSQFSASISAGTFSASFTSPLSMTFAQASLPFDDTLTLISASLSVNLGTCGFPLILLSGVLSGSFGKYTDFVSNGSASFDPCVLPNGSVVTQSGADVRLLAVLADTQAGGIQDLIAPGFYGSTMMLTNPIPVSGVTDIPLDFSLTLKNSNSTTPYGVYQFSLDGNSTSYITNVFGDDPRAGDPETQVSGQKIEAAYLYKVFENAISEISSEKETWGIYGAALPTGSWTGEPMNFTDDYSRDLANGDSQFSITNAATPWIVSQKIAPWQSGSTVPTRFELFRVLTLGDGTDTNKQFKVQIENVKLPGHVAGSDWGSFTLTLRKYSDTDKRPVVVEQYNNLNLDPNSSNFIARRIGDRYNYIDYKGKIIEFGTYSNNSQNVRIEMTRNNYPVSALPYGFSAFTTPTNSSFGTWTPTMKYTKASVYGLSPGKFPSGITFDDAPTGADAELFGLYPQSATGVGAATDNKQYFAPLPSFNSAGGTYNSVGRNVVFALDDDYELYSVGTGSYLRGSNAIPTVYDSVNESTYIKMRKFVLGFQGGFDGQSPAIPINVGGDITPGNTQGLDCTNVTSAGSIAYQQCIASLGNADEFDINLIVVPGIIHQHHPYITNAVVDMCEKRGDCFYIMDLYSDSGNPASGQVGQVVAYAGEYDTNYAAAYYPWVKILDTYNNKVVTVPPSVVLPAVYAANDKVAAEWFAPAGLNRGGVPIATQVTDRTTHEERDTLYEGKVNPIAAFPGSGITVWGQKTLQNQSSALDRINVRRLLIGIKKFFASTSKYLVFEQNVAATRNKFLSIVNPYLESVQQRSGLYAFFVKMDETNNTPDVIDQNILYGQIYLKPTKTAEYIVLDFNILPTGASFPNA